MRKLLFALLSVLFLPSTSQAQQSLYEAFRDPNANNMSAFIFVSLRLPDATLIALARDARRAGASMVLNGFIHDGPRGLEDTKLKVAQLNEACCNKGAPHWMINPMLFKRYDVVRTPTFVIGKGTSDKAQDYSKVSGEMGLPNALKFFAQESRIPDIKKRAGEVYYKAFGEKY